MTAREANSTRATRRVYHERVEELIGRSGTDRDVASAIARHEIATGLLNARIAVALRSLRAGSR